VKKKLLKPSYRCDCGWDIPVTLLDVSHEFPNSEVGLAVCKQCDSSTLLFKGRQDDEARFSDLMETLEDDPETVIKNRLWRPKSFTTTRSK